MTVNIQQKPHVAHHSTWRLHAVGTRYSAGDGWGGESEFLFEFFVRDDVDHKDWKTVADYLAGPGLGARTLNYGDMSVSVVRVMGPGPVIRGDHVAYWRA